MTKLNLTFITIGIVMFIGVMLLFYSPDWGIVNHFMEDNAVAVGDTYSDYYSNLTSQQDTLTTFATDANTQSKSAWQSIVNAGSTIFSVFNIGFGVIKLFADIPDTLGNITDSLKSAIPLPEPFWWMIGAITFILIAALLVKAYRSAPDLP